MAGRGWDVVVMDSDLGLNLAPPHRGPLTLGKRLSRSEPQFLHLRRRVSESDRLAGMLRTVSEVEDTKLSG